MIKGLTPLPWSADYKAAAGLVDKNMGSWWFGHGLDENGIETLANALQKHGPVNYFAPPPEQLPLLLKKNDDSSGPFDLQIAAVQETPIGRMGARPARS